MWHLQKYLEISTNSFEIWIFFILWPVLIKFSSANGELQNEKKNAGLRTQVHSQS